MPGSREEAAAGACAPSPRRLGRRGGARPRPARARSLAGWLARSLARSRRPEASPACAPGRSHSGACARGLGPTRVAGFPRLQGPPRRPPPGSRPTRPSLFLPEWGRRCSGSRALDPARARSRAVSRCLARAALRFPSVSGAEGSVKRRPRFLFPFLPLPSVSGVASSTPPPLPLSRRGQLQLEGSVAVATGDGADRLAPASGKGALGSRAPARRGFQDGAGAGSAEPGLRALLPPPADPRPVAATAAAAAAHPAAPGKVGREPPRCPGGASALVRVRGAVAPRIPAQGQGPEPRDPRDGGGVGGVPQRISAPTAPSPSPPPPRSGVPVVRPWEGGFLCFAGFRCALRGLGIGVNLHKDPLWRVAEAGQLMAWVPRYPPFL